MNDELIEREMKLYGRKEGRRHEES
jgi:hypothetical protein